MKILIHVKLVMHGEEKMFSQGKCISYLVALLEARQVTVQRHGRPQLSWKGGARIGQGGRHLTVVNTLSAFGRFNERGGGGGVLSTFGQFNERGGGRGAVHFRPI